jgi:hypothetical protein
MDVANVQGRRCQSLTSRPLHGMRWLAAAFALVTPNHESTSGNGVVAAGLSRRSPPSANILNCHPEPRLLRQSISTFRSGHEPAHPQPFTESAHKKGSGRSLSGALTLSLQLRKGFCISRASETENSQRRALTSLPSTATTTPLPVPHLHPHASPPQPACLLHFRTRTLSAAVVRSYTISVPATLPHPAQ